MAEQVDDRRMDDHVKTSKTLLDVTKLGYV